MVSHTETLYPSREIQFTVLLLSVGIIIITRLNPKETLAKDVPACASSDHARLYYCGFPTTKEARKVYLGQKLALLEQEVELTTQAESIFERQVGFFFGLTNTRFELFIGQIFCVKP